MDELNAIFAHRLRELREDQKMTQGELAALLNSTKIQISRYETGAIIPSIETLVKLAVAFNCSTDYLLGRADSPRDSSWREGEYSPDERRIIQAIREGDVPNTLIVLSMLVAETEKRRKLYASDRAILPNKDNPARINVKPRTKK